MSNFETRTLWSSGHLCAPGPLQLSVSSWQGPCFSWALLAHVASVIVIQAFTCVVCDIVTHLCTRLEVLEEKKKHNFRNEGQVTVLMTELGSDLFLWHPLDVLEKALCVRGLAQCQSTCQQAQGPEFEPQQPPPKRKSFVFCSCYKCKECALNIRTPPYRSKTSQAFWWHISLGFVSVLQKVTKTELMNQCHCLEIVNI